MAIMTGETEEQYEARLTEQYAKFVNSEAGKEFFKQINHGLWVETIFINLMDSLAGEKVRVSFPITEDFVLGEEFTIEKVVTRPYGLNTNYTNFFCKLVEYEEEFEIYEYFMPRDKEVPFFELVKFEELKERLRERND